MNSLCILSSIRNQFQISRLTPFWPLSSTKNEPMSPAMYKFQVLQVEELLAQSRVNPKARSGHRMVADDAGDLYSFGGYNDQVAQDDSELADEPAWEKFKPLFQELWKFNWRTRKWTKLRTTGDIPNRLVSHCMWYWEGKIIIYGGTRMPYGQTSSNRLTVYHINRNHWEVITPTSDPARSPTEMYGQACVLDEQRGELYIVGGTDGGLYSLDVHKFNLYTRKWTLLHKSIESSYGPGPRYRHEIALHNNKLYVFGGSTSTTYYGFERLPVFDLETLSWSHCKTRPYIKNGRGLYPYRRKCHSLGLIGADCYMTGGSDGHRIMTDLWHLNLDELRWTLLVEHMPYPVYFHAAAVSQEGRMTVFGGVDCISGNTRNNKLTALWLKIPSLKSMCLAAVNHYVRNGMLEAVKCKSLGFEEALEVSDIKKACEDGETLSDRTSLSDLSTKQINAIPSALTTACTRERVVRMIARLERQAARYD